MQDPNEDTQWNDILREKGILPPKPKTQDQIDEELLVAMAEESAKKVINRTRSVDLQKVMGRLNGEQKPIEDMDLDELDLLEDDETERIAAEYRAKRMAEMKAAASKGRFGSVVNITGMPSHHVCCTWIVLLIFWFLFMSFLSLLSKFACNLQPKNTVKK